MYCFDSPLVLIACDNLFKRASTVAILNKLAESG